MKERFLDNKVQVARLSIAENDFVAVMSFSLKESHSSWQYF